MSSSGFEELLPESVYLARRQLVMCLSLTRTGSWKDMVSLLLLRNVWFLAAAGN